MATVNKNSTPGIIEYMTKLFMKDGLIKLYPYHSSFLSMFAPVKNPKWRWWKFWVKKYLPRGTNFTDRPTEIDIIRGNKKINE